MGCIGSTQGTIHQTGHAGSKHQASGTANFPPEIIPYEGEPVSYTFLQADVTMTTSSMYPLLFTQMANGRFFNAFSCCSILHYIVSNILLMRRMFFEFYV